jgi:hypothetical protein
LLHCFFVFIRTFFIFFSRISSSLLLVGCKVLWYYEFDMHSSVKTPCDITWLQAECIGFVRTGHWCIKPGIMSFTFQWSWSYGSWIYNYLFNQCLLPLKLWVRTRTWRGVLDTTLCNKVCNCVATGLWFSPVLSTNKNDCHDITEILLKVVLSTINQPMHWVFIIVINYRYVMFTWWNKSMFLHKISEKTSSFIVLKNHWEGFCWSLMLQSPWWNHCQQVGHMYLKCCYSGPTCGQNIVLTHNQNFIVIHKFHKDIKFSTSVHNLGYLGAFCTNECNIYYANLILNSWINWKSYSSAGSITQHIEWIGRSRKHILKSIIKNIPVCDFFF